MATHHTCDRCGRDSTQGSDFIGHEVVLGGWMGDGTLEPREQPVQVQVRLKVNELEDDPDFCPFCQIDVLLGLIDILRAKRTPAVLTC